MCWVIIDLFSNEEEKNNLQNDQTEMAFLLVIPKLIEMAKSNFPYLPLNALYNMSLANDNYWKVMINEGVFKVLLDLLYYPDEEVLVIVLNLIFLLIKFGEIIENAMYFIKI